MQQNHLSCVARKAKQEAIPKIQARSLLVNPRVDRVG